MSTTQDTVFDLEQHFLPAWAKKPAAENRYAEFEGEAARPDDRRRERRDRPPWRREGEERRPGPGRPGEGRPRPQGRGPGPGDRGPGGPRPPRRFDDRRRDDRPPRRDRPEAPPPPLPEINVALVPDDKGVESLARQIRMTGRAYPLFEIAHMILAKPERHHVTFSVRKNAEGTAIQPLFLCALDDSLWLSEDDAVRHLLDRHFTTFYKPERTQIEPPKGVYTFVAQCGLSGVILGPPNHHDYQYQLRKLHAQRFSRMPFEAFKSRVRIVRDEATVKKWVEDQSWKTQYVCLNMPEPLTLSTREEVEKHFRETHLGNLVAKVDSHRLGGAASRDLRDHGLRRLVRQAWEDQRRFPIQVATVLSQQFASAGLQFFKVNRAVTYVAVARPHYLDLETTPVSENVRRIVTYINEHPKTTHNQLLDALVPMPPAPADGSAPAEAPPERTALNSDLHWLVHQGHVIEFADGVLDTAKKPLPRPPKPAPAAPIAAAAPETPAPTEPQAAGAEPGETAAEAGPLESAPEVPADEVAASATEATAPISEPSAAEPEALTPLPSEPAPEAPKPAEGSPGAPAV